MGKPLDSSHDRFAVIAHFWSDNPSSTSPCFYNIDLYNCNILLPQPGGKGPSGSFSADNMEA